MNLSRPRLSWHWAGAGQAWGGTQEGAAGGGQVIRSRPETRRPPWPAELPAQLPGRRHRPYRCLAQEQQPPHTPTIKLRARLPRLVSLHCDLQHLLLTSTTNYKYWFFYSSFIDLKSNFWSSIMQERKMNLFEEVAMVGPSMARYDTRCLHTCNL